MSDMKHTSSHRAPRVPVGAHLTLARKPDQGYAPIEKDRLHITVTSADKVGNAGKKPPHPMFGAFNRARPEERRSILVELVHPSWVQAGVLGRKKQMDPRGNSTPTRAPWCSTVAPGRAMRWDGREFCSVECLDSRCEYAFEQEDDEKKRRTACLKRTALLFSPIWPESGPFAGLPRMLMKVDVHALHTHDSLADVVAAYDAAWVQFIAESTGQHHLIGMPWERVKAEIGAEDYITTGIKLQLTLTQKGYSKGTPWVLSVSPAETPLEWLKAYAARTAATRRAFQSVSQAPQRLAITAREDDDRARGSTGDMSPRAARVHAALVGFGVSEEEIVARLGPPSEWTDDHIDGPVAAFGREIKGGGEE